MAGKRYATARSRARGRPTGMPRTLSRYSRPTALWRRPAWPYRPVTIARPFATYPTMLGAKGGVPFENPKFCTMYLTGSSSVTSTTGAFTADDPPMAVNSLYDPLQGGGTDQPRYYTQVAAIYEKYACYAYKIECTCLGAEKMADIGYATYDSGAAASMRELGEREYCIKKTIDVSTNGGKNSVITFTAYVDFAKLLGITRRQLLSDTTYLTNNTTDPSKKIYANFYVQGLAAQTASVTFQWKMTFYCKWGNYEGVANSPP